MINLENLNRKSDSSPFLLKRPALTPYFHPLFLIFQVPPLGEVIKIYSPLPFKKKGGIRTMVIDLCPCVLTTHFLAPVQLATVR